MLKTLLINPPAPSPVDFFKEKGRLQPLGLAYLASYLRIHNQEVEIYDAEFDRDIEAVLRKIKDTGPDIVGLSAYTANFLDVVKIAKKIKKLANPPIVVIGGAHITALPSSIQKYPYFDFAVMGEGEETLLELVRKIEKKGKNFEKIRGLVFCNGNKIISTPPRPFIRNLDCLPFPARDLLPPLSSYRPSPGMYKNLPMATMITSRGCPFKCLFCCRAVFGNTYRLRSPKNVVDEMEILVKSFGAREIKIYDDLFTLKEQRILEICKEILKRRLKISWSCSARADLITPRMLVALKKAGCWEIAYGIESGNQEVLNTIKKGLTLETIKKAVRLTQKLGIQVRGFFILGLPQDTEENMQQTIDFAKNLDLSVANFYITMPFPGTELLARYLEFGKVNKKDLKLYLSQKTTSPPFVPHGLTGPKIVKYFRKAYREFYLRPSYFIGKLLKIRSFSQFKGYSQALSSIAREFLR